MARKKKAAHKAVPECVPECATLVAATPPLSHSVPHVIDLCFLIFFGEADKAVRLRVVALRNGSAVQRSDCLQVGDTISAINGTKVNQMKADEINQILSASNERIHLEIEYQLPPTPSSSSIAGNSSPKSHRGDLTRKNVT